MPEYLGQDQRQDSSSCQDQVYYSSQGNPSANSAFSGGYPPARSPEAANHSHLDHPANSIYTSPPHQAREMTHQSTRSTAQSYPYDPANQAFSQQTPYAINMGHMAGALPGMSSQYTASIAMSPSQQSNNTGYTRQPAANTYYQQNPQYQMNTAAAQHQDRMSSMQVQQQYHAAQQYAPAYMSYPVYPQQHAQFYQQPSMIMQQQALVNHPPARDVAGRNAQYGRFQPFDKQSFPSAQVPDKNLYPFHAAQKLQKEQLNSSGGLATHGSVPDGQAVVPRGPPRKPKQSGHALWVGNLPPDATVADLKDHFAKGLSNDIESLKLISKSNCAFVNYKSQAACAMAMQKFHESRFHGTRLVCRLRRTLAPSPANTADAPNHRGGAQSLVDGEADGPAELSTPTHDVKVPERYFVLKSLTLQDLDVSVHTGHWATQPHNEDALNKAFKVRYPRKNSLSKILLTHLQTADNVYLIFSANKSGEYFGYARMASLITSEPVPELLSPQLSKTTAALSKTPSASQQSELPVVSVPSSAALSKVDSGPRAILTAATEHAPAGKIIDDLARGTIFWEADGDDELATSPDVDGVEAAFPASGSLAGDAQSAPQSSETSRPSLTTTTTNESGCEEIQLLPSTAGSFKVEWISTRRVPFYSTRGLRNPWNVNREVKIARDGTELEPSIGKKLVALFSHPGIGRIAGNPVGPMGMTMGMNMSMGAGMEMGMSRMPNAAAY